MLCTYPLEHMAAKRPNANPESTWRLYSALATAARAARPVRVDDPRVLVGLLRTGPADTALFVNCSADAIAAEPILDGWTTLEPADGPIALDPFGVALVPGAAPIADRAADADARHFR